MTEPDGYRPVMSSLLWSVVLCALFPIKDLNASCTPQCVAHARRESGIYTNRVGAYRGAVDWFEQASLSGDTKSDPGAGYVGLPLILGGQPGINPKYGHAVFVERSREIVNDRAYQLRVSHSNFDGRCSTEVAEAYYFPATKEIQFTSGFFSGRTFRVEGLITR